MNRLKFLFSFLILSLTLLQSCSIEKRHYTSGYHIEWKKGNSEGKVQYTEPQTQNSLTASSEKKKAMVVLSSDSIKCDTLIMKDGTEVKAKVLEVTPTEVKYKFCNNINGPLYVAYRYNLSYIKYANGTMDSFVNEHPPVTPPSNRNNGGYNNQYRGGNNQNNNGAAFNGNNNRYDMDNYATSEYVRKTSTASLILGIVSIPLLDIGIGFITAIIAIVLAKKCLRLIKQNPEHLWMYSKRATAGLVLGWVVIGMVLLILLFLLLLLAATGVI
jgi:hypothetical protein